MKFEFGSVIVTPIGGSPISVDRVTDIVIDRMDSMATIYGDDLSTLQSLPFGSVVDFRARMTTQDGADSTVISARDCVVEAIQVYPGSRTFGKGFVRLSSFEAVANRIIIAESEPNYVVSELLPE